MLRDLNDTYKMMMLMTMMMMIRMMKTQNGHKSAKFEATLSRFCMVIDLNDTYGMKMMMMMLMIIMMMMLMMIKPKIAITRPILKLQHPDFAW